MKGPLNHHFFPWPSRWLRPEGQVALTTIDLIPSSRMDGHRLLHLWPGVAIIEQKGGYLYVKSHVCDL